MHFNVKLFDSVCILSISSCKESSTPVYFIFFKEISSPIFSIDKRLSSIFECKSCWTSFIVESVELLKSRNWLLTFSKTFDSSLKACSEAIFMWASKSFSASLIFANESVRNVSRFLIDSSIKARNSVIFTAASSFLLLKSSTNLSLRCSCSRISFCKTLLAPVCKSLT